MKELNEKLARWRWPSAESVKVDEYSILVIQSEASGLPHVQTSLFTESLDADFTWLVEDDWGVTFHEKSSSGTFL